MATLHVRNLSDSLYQQIQELATAENLSLSAKVSRLLQQAVEEENLRIARKQVLAEMRRRRFVPPPEAPKSIVWLREDRAR
jgi:antitoxin FitA